MSRVAGITMPGYGTSARTLESARKLMQGLGIAQDEIDIRQVCLDTFRAIGHKPFGLHIESLDVPQFQKQLGQVPKEKRHDLVFENVQARMRTLLLMSRGFVLGTGDLSNRLWLEHLQRRPHVDVQRQCIDP